jgi:hypothetical protein
MSGLGFHNEAWIGGRDCLIGKYIEILGGVGTPYLLHELRRVAIKQQVAFCRILVLNYYTHR